MSTRLATLQDRFTEKGSRRHMFISTGLPCWDINRIGGDPDGTDAGAIGTGVGTNHMAAYAAAVPEPEEWALKLKAMRLQGGLITVVWHDGFYLIDMGPTSRSVGHSMYAGTPAAINVAVRFVKKLRELGMGVTAYVATYRLDYEATYGIPGQAGCDVAGYTAAVQADLAMVIELLNPDAVFCDGNDWAWTVDGHGFTNAAFDSACRSAVKANSENCLFVNNGTYGSADWAAVIAGFISEINTLEGFDAKPAQGTTNEVIPSQSQFSIRTPVDSGNATAWYWSSTAAALYTPLQLVYQHNDCIAHGCQFMPAASPTNASTLSDDVYCTPLMIAMNMLCVTPLNYGQTGTASGLYNGSPVDAANRPNDWYMHDIRQLNTGAPNTWTNPYARVNLATASGGQDPWWKTPIRNGPRRRTRHVARVDINQRCDGDYNGGNLGDFRDLVAECLDANGVVLAASAVLNPDNVLGANGHTGAAERNYGPSILSADFDVDGVYFVRVRKITSTKGYVGDQCVLCVGMVCVYEEPLTAAYPLGLESFAVVAQGDYKTYTFSHVGATSFERQTMAGDWVACVSPCTIYYENNAARDNVRALDAAGNVLAATYALAGGQIPGTTSLLNPGLGGTFGRIPIGV